MGVEFERVGVVARLGGELVADSVAEVARVLDAAGVTTVFESSTAEVLDEPDLETLGRDELGDACDLIIVVGGDGSLLGIGRDLAHKQVPVLGVNRGGLGFLAGMAPEDIELALPEVLAGKYVSEEHFLLETIVSEGERELFRSPALNDVVMDATGRSHMLELRVWINDEWVYDQRGDGLIVASPTGSTAYSLSAGGPIMHPSLNAIAIVPMFPHTLTSRPLVVRGNSNIRVAVENAKSTQARVSCDSQVHFNLSDEQEITIQKYAAGLTLIYPMQHSFYDSCRSKLDWATRLGDR